MTDCRLLSATYRFGMVAVLAALALAGCNRNAEPLGKAPVAETPGQSAEYPMVTPAPDSAPAPTAGSLKVTVSLSPALAKKAAPNDVVFIFARAVQGPRMPLAIVRKQVKDLPTMVVLDDSLSMSPEMKLSSVSEVVVVARVSKSGMAGAQAGDLEGMSGPVKTGNQAVAVSIANVVAGK
jgi:cytochrome c-type biogenesis protein CcmH